MIEPTDEMEAAYDDAAWESSVSFGGLEMANVRAGLAAVLAIVERDHCLKPRDHPFHPPTRWPAKPRDLGPQTFGPAPGSDGDTRDWYEGDRG